MKKSCKTCEFWKRPSGIPPCSMCNEYDFYCWKHTVKVVVIFLVVLLGAILTFAYWWGCKI